jgi:hypothetical protein
MHLCRGWGVRSLSSVMYLSVRVTLYQNAYTMSSKLGIDEKTQGGDP